MERSKWTERKFTFDFPEGWMPNILERLHGTPLRIAEMIKSLSEEQGNFKPDGKWSIKENIGHLSDLEDLHDGRLDDFISRKTELRAADMKNEKTHQANHNSRPIAALLEEFTAKRKEFVSRLEALDDEVLMSSSMHPRLKVMMRPVDVAFFTAEHDDHHLADMRAILKVLNVNNL